MTQQAQTTTAPQPAPTVADLPTLEQRVAATHDDIRAEKLETTAEPADGAAPAEASPSAETKPSADSAAVDPVAARRERLANLQKREEERRLVNERRGEQDRIRQEAEQARKEAEEARALAARLVDPASLKDPRKLVAFAEEHGIPADKFAEAIRESIAHPERAASIAAAEAARKAVDPEVAALKAKLAELEAKEKERETAWHQAQQQRQEAEAASQFFAFTKENAPTAPFSARFLEKHGEQQFYTLANTAAQQLPPGSGWQAVLDTIEEHLTALSTVYSTDADTKSKPPAKRSAAAKATTLSNSLAQERASVVEEEDWSSLPFDERVARMKR